MKLYEIPSIIESILARADEADGELTPELLAELEAVEIEQEYKLESICKLVKNYLQTEAVRKAEGDQFLAEADRIYGHAKVAAGNAKRLKEYMQRCLEAMNLKRAEAGTFKVRIQANSQPSVIIDESVVDVRKLPMEYLKLEPNKSALALAAGRGEELPEGVRVERGSHLRIS